MMFSKMVASQRRILLTSMLQRRSFVRASRPLWEKKTMMVPTMGDSITEGTIVEWTAAIGQQVKDGDVVAMVETDKVTVEIKAEGGGVVTQHFGSVDDVVEVGAKLYELDTEGEGFAAEAHQESKEQATSTTTTTEVPSTPTAVDTTTPAHHRIPMIHFLGKDGWQERKTPSSPKQKKSTSPLAITVLPEDDKVRNPMYGRPAFTEEEMEALMAGGATIAPDVAYFSSGAKFLQAASD